MSQMVRFSIGRFFLSRPAMRFSRTPRGFEISAGFAGFDFRSTSPLTHLSFFSNLQCTKRMMRANAGRHHGETVGLFSRDLSHVWMIDCSGSFSTSLSFIVRAFDLLEKKHTKTLEALSPRLTKKCTFFLLPQPKRHRRSLRSAVGFRERFSPPGLQTRRER